jgi:hypothetical protein
MKLIRDALPLSSSSTGSLKSKSANKSAMCCMVDERARRGGSVHEQQQWWRLDRHASNPNVVVASNPTERQAGLQRSEREGKKKGAQTRVNSKKTRPNAIERQKKKVPKRSRTVQCSTIACKFHELLKNNAPTNQAPIQPWAAELLPLRLTNFVELENIRSPI